MVVVVVVRFGEIGTATNAFTGRERSCLLVVSVGSKEAHSAAQRINRLKTDGRRARQLRSVVGR